jgi:hypothetical protein
LALVLAFAVALAVIGMMVMELLASLAPALSLGLNRQQWLQPAKQW